MLESELFTFLDNTTEAAFAVRETEEICFWSHAAESLFGYPEKEALGETCHALLQGMDSLGIQAWLNHSEILSFPGGRSNIPNFDLSVKTCDKQRIWISLSTLIYRNGRTGASLIVHLAHDISVRKKREDLLYRVTALSKEINSIVDEPTHYAPVSILSKCELQILQMFAAGLSSSAVVKKLQITPQTLRNHLHHVNCKLGTHNRLEAVTHAIRRKLI
ncbi:MAG: LuxR C-terminal-related transcriptional regulator [Edaphobacter sp.]